MLFLPIWDHLLGKFKGSVPHPPHLSLLIHRYKHPLPLWCRSDMDCWCSQHSEDENTSSPVNGRSNTCTVVPLTSSRCHILEFGGFVRWAVIIWSVLYLPLYSSLIRAWTSLQCKRSWKEQARQWAKAGIVPPRHRAHVPLPIKGHHEAQHPSCTRHETS